MTWQAASWLLLGGSTALLFLDLPVAFSFLGINIVGAVLFLGSEPGLVQLARNSVEFCQQLLAARFDVRMMGELLFHTGLAVKVLNRQAAITRVPGRPVIAVVAGPCSAMAGSTIAVTAVAAA